MRTNIAALALQNWNDSFLAQLSSCLHNYSHEFRYGLTGSGEPYNGLVLPWGQNLCTDYLLSGAGLTIIHDGAAFSRTEKVAEIVKDEAATRALKVCWEGADKSTNCGVCEKCVRTRLNFMAVGSDKRSCFDGQLSKDQIRLIKTSNAAQRVELISILDYATKRGMTGGWIDGLKQCLHFNRSGPIGRAALHLAHGDFGHLRAKIARRLF